MHSRRSFLKRTLGTGLALTMQGPHQATAQTPAAQPGRRRMIVDAQVHLWLPQGPDRPWPAGRVAQLPYPFTYDLLLPMMNDAGVDRVVIVPPSWEGERIDYALEAARKYPDRFALMGRILLNSPQSPGLLPKWKAQPGMLGIRVTFNGAQTAWLTDGTADWFWPAAEKAGIPIMFLVGGRMPEFARIAERHPQLAMIIDHMGVSAAMAKDNALTSGIDQTVAMAKYPNVSVKLSSSPSLSTEPYPFRDVKVHVRRCFDAFGPQRCHWGTDMTNSFAKATYRQRITHFTEELDFLSEEDKDWVMGRAILQRLRWA